MSILNPNEFEKVIREYIRLQTALQREFIKQNRLVHDWKFLTDVPSHGHVHTLGVVWSCTKHGVGIRFVNEKKGVIDVHNHISVSGLVDAQRICEYLISLDGRLEKDTNLHEKCRKALEEASADGVIRRSEFGEEMWRVE